MYTIDYPASGYWNVLLFSKKELEEVEKIYKAWKLKLVSLKSDMALHL